MSLSEQLALDAALFVNPDDFGIAVTCTVPGVDPFPLNVGFVESSTAKSGEVIRGDAQMSCPVAEPPAGLAELVGGTTFTLADGRVFTFNAVCDRKTADGLHVFTVNRQATPTLRRF